MPEVMPKNWNCDLRDPDMYAPTDPYEEFARFYDVYVGDRLDDLPLYLEYARFARTPILEIGAGSGRLTVPFARHGIAVVAVDVSPAMLALFRARLSMESSEAQRNIKVVHSDVCSLALNARFDLVIVPFYTFNYLLTAETQSAALQRLAQHLTERGRLLIDVFLPTSHLETPPLGRIVKVDRVDLLTGNRIRGWNEYRYDRPAQIQNRQHTFEVLLANGQTQKHAFTIRRRYLFREQLELLFLTHGFVVEDLFGGYQREPVGDRFEQLIYVLCSGSSADQPSGYGT